MAIPVFRSDGYLPEGTHVATEEEVVERLGLNSSRRQFLMHRVRRWLTLSRTVRAQKFLLDGSFVTSKVSPGDVDAVVWLPTRFAESSIEFGDAGLELVDTLITRQPQELFGAEDEDDWNEWIDFFSRTRERDGRRKGLVEIEL